MQTSSTVIEKSTFQLHSFSTFNEILEDLTSRFIINIPALELESIERVLFQIELAHWFYEDYVLEEFKQNAQAHQKQSISFKLKSFTLRQFSLLIFQSCILLKHWVPKHEKAFDTFMKYKIKVPVCGAIILNSDMTKVLLVRGWKSNASWGFPKGKINQDETETSCAIREVFEETGFDISAYVRDQEFLERRIYEQRVRLYMVAGIDESVEFLTQTKKEIGDIKWHSLNSIPGFLKNSAVSEDEFIHSKNKKYKFYMITPFIISIRKWIAKFKAAQKEGKDRSRAGLRVTMDEEDNANDSDADLLNQAVSEQHHYFFQQQNPHADQYSSAMVPQTQRVELEGSLKSLLGMGGGEYMPLPQAAQSHFTTQSINIPMSHHPIPSAFPPHRGSFPDQSGLFGSFHGQPMSQNIYFNTGISKGIPTSNPMSMMGGPTFPNNTSMQNGNIEEPGNGSEPPPQLETIKESGAVDKSLNVEKSGSSPDRQRKNMLLDILMGAGPDSSSTASGMPSDSDKKSEKSSLLDVLVGVGKSEQGAKKPVKSEKDQKALLDILGTATSLVVDSSKEKVAAASPRKSKKEKGNAVESSVISNGDETAKKSPKKKKKEKSNLFDGKNEKANNSGLQFGAVQILKRPAGISKEPSAETDPSAVQGSNQREVVQNEVEDRSVPPAIKTTRQDSSSQLLEIINSSRKNSPAENQSLLDALFHGAAPKTINDDPGLQMALSGRALSRSSSIASARVTSPQPGQITKERPSLVDILKGVPLPPQQQSVNYARSLSPTSPKVRPASPEKPMFTKMNINSDPKSPRNGLLDILISGGEASKSAQNTSQQSLVDILQGIPKPPGHSSSINESVQRIPTITPALSVGSGSLTDLLAPTNPSIVTSTSTASVPPASTSKKEGKNSLMDILIGGFSLSKN